MDGIVQNDLNIDKFYDNSYKQFAKYLHTTSQKNHQTIDTQIEMMRSAFGHLTKEAKETQAKLDLQRSAQSWQNKIAGRPVSIDMDKHIKYLNDDQTKS